MTRDDLLALTDDDLAALATRGAVRRARHDVEAGEVTVDEHADGALTAKVADREVAYPPAGPPAAARCSCPATAVCRHVVAVVLAYRAQHAHEQRTAMPWDPGTLDNATLAAACAGAPGPARSLAEARARLTAGTTWTLARGTRPWATLHEEDRTILFPVPHAIEHARCSCRQPAPCRHALAAALSFRELPEDEAAGLVETARAPAAPLPDSASDVLRRLVELGAAGGARTLPGELEAAARACRRAALPSPAAGFEELAELVRRFAAGDASYDPATVAAAVGELTLRLRLLDRDAAWPPRGFVAGFGGEQEREVRGGRLIGLGTSVRRRGRSVSVVVHLAEVSDGTACALVATFTDPAPPEPPRSFATLASTSVGGVALRAYGAGQVVARGTRRGADGRISFGRRPVSVTPQAFAWSDLLGPALAADAAAVRAAAATRLPAPLAPRRAAGAPIALALASVRDAGFSHARQAVVVTTNDRDGTEVMLHQPFLSRAAAGTDALLAALDGREEERIVLVAGHVRALDPLVLEPTGIVLERHDGTRRMLQPSTDPPPERVDSQEPASPSATIAAPTSGSASVLAAVFADAQALVGALLTSGARRADTALTEQARAVTAELARLRSVRLHTASRRLATALAATRTPDRTETSSIVDTALSFAALLQLARELHRHSGP